MEQENRNPKRLRTKKETDPIMALYGLGKEIWKGVDPDEYVRELRGDCESIGFTVIDKQTGKPPDLKKIARTEEWAKNLIDRDMEGFCLGENGKLYLLDKCGNWVYAPRNRFVVLRRRL